MKSRALLLILVLTAGAVFLPGATAAPVPDLAPMSGQTIAAGVHYTKYHWRHSAAPIYIAQIANNSGASLQVIAAHNLIGGGRETVSSMCGRTPGCVAAVNGDFWDISHPSAAVLGGMVIHGEMWKSPNRTGQQVSVAPPRFGLTWSGELTGKAGRTIRLAGVNTAPVPNATVLYTPRYGQAIGAGGNTAFESTAPAQLLGRLGRTTALSALHSGVRGTRVHTGQAGFVTSGTATTELEALFRGGGVTLTLSTSEPTSENIGYHPAIMRDGRLLHTDPRDPMLSHANPRTLLAWSPTRTWLVVADGREHGGPGLTVGEVVALVRDLGATNAVMLDGGGSTTFDAAGRVVNQPSDGQERPVSNALAVVVPVPPHKVVAPRPAAATPRAAPRHVPRPPVKPAKAAKPARPVAGTTAIAHPKPRHTVAPAPHPSAKPVTHAASLPEHQIARPPTRAIPHPAHTAQRPIRHAAALSPAAAEQVPAHAASYYDWHAVALVIVFAIAGLALIVFVRRELRRGSSPSA